MHVDRELFMEQGFLILRNVVPRDQLAQLRWHFETALEAQKLLWAKEAGPDDPPGGLWEQSPMPTLSLDLVVEPQTAPGVEFCLAENTLGVCAQLMQAEPAPRAIQMMCSPIVDYGHTDWHRDIDSIAVAPFEGLAMDTQANGPGELQWNIALYDDDVFWVVPGSHLRPETEAETRQLLKDPRVPLPGAQQVALKAGDAVVYTNILLHWGSIYTAKLRRTVHFVYRAFGGQLFPHYHLPQFNFDFDFIEQLAPVPRAAFERFQDLYTQERKDIERLLRAILARDEATFRVALDVLHPGKKGKMVALVLLSKWAQYIATLSRADVRNLPMEERASAAGVDSFAVPFYAEVAHRFTESEGQALKLRFAGLEAQMAADREAAYARIREQFRGFEPIPGDPSSFDFRTRATRTLYSNMPTDYGLDEFIADWDG
jgi:hypothetical protein